MPESTEEAPISMGEWKQTHPEYKKIEQHLKEATGEQPEEVHSPSDPEHRPTNIIDMAGQLVDPSQLLGADQTENIEGVTESAKRGFRGWWDGFVRGRPRVSDHPKAFADAKDAQTASIGQIKEIPNEVKEAA